MNFQWDVSKRRENIRKHHIDFEDVKNAFTEPMLIALDLREDYREDRWIGLGVMNGIVVVIVFTEPDEDTFRIISARRATKNESKKYYEKIQY